MGEKVEQRQGLGASSGSREPSPAVSALSGFDPARVRQIVQQLRGPEKWCCIFMLGGHARHGTSELPLKAADELERLLAIAAGSGTARTPQAIECEASQSGAKRIAPIQTPKPERPTMEDNRFTTLSKGQQDERS